jgi:hypothetical protein
VWIDWALEKKKHHYVPVTYLSRFTDADGFITCARKPDPTSVIRVRPDEIGFRRYYYSQPLPWGGHDNNRLEGGLAELDGQWAQIVEPLLAGAPSNHIVGDLFAFMAFQRVRVPAFRSAIEQAMARSAKGTFDQLLAAGEIDPSPEEYPDLVSQVIFKIDPHQSIHAMTKLMRSTREQMESFGFVVLHNRTELDFITSDNPVSYFSKRGAEIFPYKISSRTENEFIFPISPRAVIVGRSTDFARYARKGLKHISTKDVLKIKEINNLVARFAYEAVFSNKPLGRSFVIAHSQTSPVLDPEFLGFDPDSMRLPPFVFGERTSLPKWDRNRDYKPHLPGLP